MSAKVAPLRLPPAALLDRDGVLVVDGGYVSDPAALVPVAGAGGAVGRLVRSGYFVVVVTNQRGVSLGKMSVSDVVRCNERTRALLAAEDREAGNIHFTFSPHDKDDARYRKPGTGLVDCFRGFFDPEGSVAVGDRASDLELGVRSGVPAERCFWIRNGEHAPPDPRFPVAASLAQVVDLVTTGGRPSS